MTTINPPAWKKIRYFTLLPLVLLILMCTETRMMATSDDDLQRMPVPATAEMGKDGILIAGKADSTQNENQKELFYIVEDMPDFQGGGQDAFRKYIAENLSYPERAVRDRFQGKVFVQFVVKADGSVADATIVRGVHPDLDREALRVVMSSPRWTPGRQKGQAVNVTFVFPVNFVLQKWKQQKKEESRPYITWLSATLRISFPSSVKSRPFKKPGNPNTSGPLLEGFDKGFFHPPETVIESSYIYIPGVPEKMSGIHFLKNN